MNNLKQEVEVEKYLRSSSKCASSCVFLVFFNVLHRRVDVYGKHEQAVCSLLMLPDRISGYSSLI